MIYHLILQPPGLFRLIFVRGRSSEAYSVECCSSLRSSLTHSPSFYGFLRDATSSLAPFATLFHGLVPRPFNSFAHFARVFRSSSRPSIPFAIFIPYFASSIFHSVLLIPFQSSPFTTLFSRGLNIQPQSVLAGCNMRDHLRAHTNTHEPIKIGKNTLKSHDNTKLAFQFAICH